jgi:membrane protease YdiL (CAAX protease family)/TPR repeat protein
VGDHTFYEDIPLGPATAGLYVVAVLNNEVLLQRHYNTYMDAGACAILLADLDSLPTGTFVVVAAKDEATRRFDESGQLALELIGASAGLIEEEFRTSYFCMGAVGLRRGTAVERVGNATLSHSGARVDQPVALNLDYVAQVGPAGEATPKTRKKITHVKARVHRKDGKVTVSWTYPKRLAEEFKSQPSEEARAELGFAELHKQANDGDRESFYKLGYLYLYGIGTARDLEEAEERFRFGLEVMERPGGARRLAWELIAGDEENRDADKAADLVLGSLSLNYKNAIRTADKIAYYFIRQAEPPDLPKAMEILDAVLTVDPEHAYSLSLAAYVCQQAGDLEGAWEMATRVVELEDGVPQNKIKARLIRLLVANETGHTEQLERADFIEPVKYAVKKIPKGIVWVVAGFFGLGLMLVPVLMVFLTRRYISTTAGIFLAFFWILYPALAGGVWIYYPLMLFFSAIYILLVTVLSLTPELRRYYMPIRPLPSGKQVCNVMGVVIGWLFIFYLFEFVYGALFEMISGHSLNQQVMTELLKTDKPTENAMIFFMIAISTPIIEEIAFRGYLLDWMRRRMSWNKSVIIVSVLFGLLHGLTMMLPIVILGFIAALLRKRYDSLWPSILLHALNNGIAMTMLLLCE